MGKFSVYKRETVGNVKWSMRLTTLAGSAYGFEFSAETCWLRGKRTISRKIAAMKLVEGRRRLRSIVKKLDDDYMYDVVSQFQSKGASPNTLRRQAEIKAAQLEADLQALIEPEEHF